MKSSEKHSSDSILVAWEIDEYARHDRGTRWHVGAVVLGLGMLIYAFVTSNFLFALIIVMFAIILVMSASRPPGKLAFAITKDGVVIGERFLSHREFTRFWIVFEPGDVKCLYLDFRGVLRPHLTIPLEDADPNEVRSALKAYITEDLSEQGEPMSDFLGRVLKL